MDTPRRRLLHVSERRIQRRRLRIEVLENRFAPGEVLGLAAGAAFLDELEMLLSAHNYHRDPILCASREAGVESTFSKVLDQLRTEQQKEQPHNHAPRALQDPVVAPIEQRREGIKAEAVPISEEDWSVDWLLTDLNLLDEASQLLMVRGARYSPATEQSGVAAIVVASQSNTLSSISVGSAGVSAIDSPNERVQSERPSSGGSFDESQFLSAAITATSRAPTTKSAAVVFSGPIDEGTGETTSPVKYFVGDGVITQQDLWWFNGESPLYYSTGIDAECISYPGYPTAPDGWFVWTVTEGQDLIDIGGFGGPPDDEFEVGGWASAVIFSTGASAPADEPTFDITIEVRYNGDLVGTVEMAVGTAHKLVHLRDVDTPDATLPNNGYRSDIRYKILDQFGDVLPKRIEVNEKFTTSDEEFPDMTNDWMQGDDEASFVNPADWPDGIEVVGLGLTPDPLPPGNPLSIVEVDHWYGEWYVGSLLEGAGVKVQTNKWQRYQDHARHENAVSPPA